MLSRAKKLKLDQDDAESSAGSSDLTKILPSEVIEKIISFVPSKLNCFLVSKDFQREAINATRNKCILNLSPTNLVSKGLMKTRWAFDEIQLATDMFRIEYGSKDKSLQKCRDQAFDVFKKFGSQVKKFSIFNMEIHETDFLYLLTLLPNLVELHVQSCRPTDKFGYFLTSSNGILGFPKLEKITIIGTWLSWLERISCPIIQDLRVRDWYGYFSDVENFLQQHNQIKNIELLGHSSKRISFEHLQLSELSLHSSIIPEDQAATMVQNQRNLKKLSLNCYIFMTDQLLQKIVMLQYLESLDIHIRSDALMPEPLIEEIMQMSRLKSFKVRTGNINFISTLMKFKNCLLEELSLNTLFRPPFDSIPRLGDIAEKFPNLKKLSLSAYQIRRNDFNNLLQLKKLKCIKLQFVSFDENSLLFVTNTSIRELKIVSYKIENTIKLLNVMPNLKRLIIEIPYQRNENRKIVEAALNLKSLQELTGSFGFLGDNKVLTFIMEYQESTKLERIIISNAFHEERSAIVNVCAAYKTRFPVIHVNHKMGRRITMSRM